MSQEHFEIEIKLIKQLQLNNEYNSYLIHDIIKSVN